MELMTQTAPLTKNGHAHPKSQERDINLSILTTLISRKVLKEPTKAKDKQSAVEFDKKTREAFMFIKIPPNWFKTPAYKKQHFVHTGKQTNEFAIVAMKAWVFSKSVKSNAG